MSNKDLLKEYIDRLDAIASGETINEADDNYHVNDLLDQLESALQQAVRVCGELEDTEQLGRVVGAYTRPWLQAWISDRHQMGSVDSMRGTLEDNAEDDDYEN